MTPKMKWMFVILALSVAGNLFAAGIWLGKEFGPGPGKRLRAGSPAEHIEFNMRKLAEVLPEDKRRDLRQIFRDNHETMREHFATMRASEEQMKTLMLAETVDIPALEKAFESHHDMVVEFREPMKRVMTEIFATLDQETRKTLVETIWQGRRGSRRFGGRGPGPGMGPPGGPGMPPPNMMPPGEDGPPPPPEDDADTPKKSGS